MTEANKKIAEHVMGKMLDAISSLKFPNAHQKKLAVYIPGVLIDLVAEYWKILNPHSKAFKLLDGKVFFNSIELIEGYEVAVVACMPHGMIAWNKSTLVKYELDVTEKQMYAILKDRFQIASKLALHS